MNETMDRAFQEAHNNKALRKAEHYIYWVDFHKVLLIKINNNFLAIFI